MQFYHRTCAQIAQVTKIPHFMQICDNWRKKSWDKSGWIFRINLEIFRDKIGIYKHFLGEFPDRFLGYFSGFWYLGLAQFEEQFVFLDKYNIIHRDLDYFLQSRTF